MHVGLLPKSTSLTNWYENGLSSLFASVASVGHFVRLRRYDVATVTF